MRNFTNSEGAYKFNQLVSSRQNAVLGQHLGNGRVRLDSGPTVTAIIASGTPPGKVACFFDGQNWYAEASSGNPATRTVIDKRYRPPVVSVGDWGLLYIFYLSPASNADEESTISRFYAHWSTEGTTFDFISAEDEFWNANEPENRYPLIVQRFYASALSAERAVIAARGIRVEADIETPGTYLFEVLELNPQGVTSRWRYEVPTTTYLANPSAPLPYTGEFTDFVPTTLEFSNLTLAANLGITLQNGVLNLITPDDFFSAEPVETSPTRAVAGGFCEDRKYYQFKPNLQQLTEAEQGAGYMSNFFGGEEKTIQEFTGPDSSVDIGISTQNVLDFGNYSAVVKRGSPSVTWMDLYQTYRFEIGTSQFGAEFQLSQFLENLELCLDYDKLYGEPKVNLPANSDVVPNYLNTFPYEPTDPDSEVIFATSIQLSLIRALPYPL